MRLIILLVSFLISSIALAQPAGEIKFGKITAADFTVTDFAVDSSTEAIVLADVASTQVKGSRKGGLALEFKRLRRVLILNKAGYDQAKVEIELYTLGDREELLDNMRAATYNLNGGAVSTEKVDMAGSLYREKVDKNTVVKKFAFPQVKEGSIIEYEYKITSDFIFNLQPWYFQDVIPVAWSEYTVAIPQFLNYILVGQGTQSFYLKEQNDKTGSFVITQPKDVAGYSSAGSESETLNVTCGVTEFRWGMKNTAPLKREPFSSSVMNYMSKLEFQFAGYREPYTEIKVLTTWQEMIKSLLESEDFGGELNKATNWLSSELTPVIGSASTNLDKARNIHAFFRDQFQCTDYWQLYTDQSLKDAFGKKSGGVAEINLLLTAMLRAAGIPADPIILSRKERGLIYPKYPVRRRFNYVICRTMIDGKEYWLDAAEPNHGFGKIDPGCYNGLAKLVDANATDINMRSDLLLEKSKTTVQMNFEGKSQWTAAVNQQQGYYESVDTRRKIKKDGKESFIKQIQESDPGKDMLVKNLVIDSLNVSDMPLTLRYDLSVPTATADIYYLDPVLIDRLKQNPLRSPSRLYPVEMPYLKDALYTITIAVPAGYKVEELPKPTVIKMPDDGAVFTYKSSIGGSSIKISCQMEINKTTIPASSYTDLREFYNMVVAKQAEQVVLKKL